MKRVLLTYVAVGLLTSCSSMSWHDGAVIQYQNIKRLEDNQYHIEVLGVWKHTKASFESAVLIKARELCISDAKIISSKMSTYPSTVDRPEVRYSEDAPMIISQVQCIIDTP